MEKEFIKYEQALTLKNLDFNEPCFAGYRDADWIGTDGANSRYFHAQLFKNSQFDNDQKKYCSSPTYSQVFRWFRKNHNLDPQIKSWKELDKIVYYISTEPIGKPSRFKCYEVKTNSYEEAELACLQTLISIVKNKII